MKATSQDEIGHPKPEDGVAWNELRNGSAQSCVDRHGRVRQHAAMWRILVVRLIRPRAVILTNMVLAVRQRRRFGAQLLGLLCVLQTAVRTVHAPGAGPWPRRSWPYFFRLGLGSGDDGLGLGDGRAVLADDAGDLVERIAATL